METTLTSKGQVTIPKHIRDSMDMQPGCKVFFAVNDAGEVVLRKSGPIKEKRPDRFDPRSWSCRDQMGWHNR